MPFNSLSEITAFKRSQGSSPEGIAKLIRDQQALVNAAQDAETAARIAAIAAARVSVVVGTTRRPMRQPQRTITGRPSFDAYLNVTPGWPTASDPAEGHMFQVNSTMGNGLYLVSFSAHWVFNTSTTKRVVSIYHRPSAMAVPGNTEWISEFASVAGSVSRATITGPIRAEVGDFIGVAALQDTGGNLGIVGGTGRTKLEIIKLQDH